MEIQEILDLLPDMEKLRSKIITNSSRKNKVAEFLKQLDPAGHDIMDQNKRPNKIVTVTEGEQEVVKSVAVSRLTVSFQKNIVGMAAAFLCGNPIKLAATPTDAVETDMLSVLNRTWKKTKLDYDTKEMCNILFSETEVAELWYRVAADDFYWRGTKNESRPHRLRMKILANSLGDSLYPVFNMYGDMIAFGRGYTVKVEEKDEEHFDIYTDKFSYLSVKKASAWVTTTEQNLFGKIPVIYYSQPAPEWADVQSLIDRFEVILSNHADANSRHLFPMIKITGKLSGAPIQGESGNILEIENGGDADYLEWKQITQSLELEFKNLRSLIFDTSSTPDISIEQMKSLGTYSGVALKMLFLAAHLKAADKERTVGKSIQRRINFIIAALSVINNDLAKAASMDVAPHFEYYLPKDDQGIVDMLVSATGGKSIMTVETAVRKNPLVDNADQEIEKLREELSVNSLENPV